ncbi:hypothetical protein [Longimicrobium sp.]|uniref:hypothetical protein n=1 Tax=Longimicrobium sp. TaxID=2029185 RepID=UPI002B572286|nr:hypothetical protein [Longimicrobium sp.]HSU13894.1 hypothetical protein [Longimicrobium sp.]
MSAASAPVLALLPPGPAPSPVSASLADRARVVRRTRAGATAVCVTGALLPLPFVLMERWIGEGQYLGIVGSWLFLFGIGGLVLFIVAVSQRTRDDLRAMLVAIATFVAAVALLPAAGRVGTEAYVSTHAVELDALAARVRAEWRPAPPDGRLDEAQLALRAEARRRNLGRPRVVDGGIVFQSGELFGSDLFYSDGVKNDAAFQCRDLRSIGGRWYTASCSGPGSE